MVFCIIIVQALSAFDSYNYVKEIIHRVPRSQLHLATSVKSLTTVSQQGSPLPQVLLQTNDGKIEEFDHVILACHSDSALSILKSGGAQDGSGGISPDEQSVLEMFRWVKNECVMHHDVDVRL